MSMFCIVIIVEEIGVCGFYSRMLCEVYFEALLVDEELADQVWEAWDAGEIGDETAFLT
jgi:hypothetical protein